MMNYKENNQECLSEEDLQRQTFEESLGYEFLLEFERLEFLRMTKGIQINKMTVFLRKTYKGRLTKNLSVMSSFVGLKD